MKPPVYPILTAAIMAAVSCTTVTTETDTQTKIKQGVPGGEFVETTRLEATVTAIDTAKRKVTLVTRKGEKFTVNPGPEVENFDQIRIGDQLRVAFTEEITVRMAKPGEKPKDSGEAEFEFAPRGSKPGVMTSETYQVVATVTAIDQKKRKATLQFSGWHRQKVRRPQGCGPDPAQGGRKGGDPRQGDLLHQSRKTLTKWAPTVSSSSTAAVRH